MFNKYVAIKVGFSVISDVTLRADIVPYLEVNLPFMSGEIATCGEAFPADFTENS